MATIDRLGKYQLLEQIRYGSLGRLYRAQDPLLKRVVALKVLVEGDITDEVRARFFAEARASAKLSHPNIITVYDVGEDQGRLFIVMEHVEGEGIEAVIRRRADVPLEVKLAAMLQICRGLGYAHRQGVVHADVKPGNVMVLRDGTIKLLDFGLARIAATAQASASPTAIAAVAASPYQAPERARARGDRRSDIFSAAALFYELTASGSPAGLRASVGAADDAPVGPPSFFAPDPSIPADLGAVLERALRREPDERFRDMAEMEAALGSVDDRLRSEARALRQRIAATAAEVQELHARIAERLGAAPAAVATPPAEGAPLAALEAGWRDLQEAAARARAQLERAEAWRPVYEAAAAHEDAGELAAAVEAFQRVVAAMPEHAAAVQGLARARRRRGEDDAPSAALPPLAPEATPAGGWTLPVLPVAPEVSAIEPDGEDAAGAPPARGARRRVAAAIAVAAVALLAGGGAVYWQAAERATARERAELDAARGQLEAARAAAARASAELLSPDQFADAAALDRVQRDLAEARHWRDATVSARAAAQAYTDAARRAGAAARAAADEARGRMWADKRRGAPGAPGYDQGLRAEQEGDGHYAAGRFPEAARAFLSAGRLFAQEAPSAPPAAPPAETTGPDAEIRDVLRSYARAFETKDLELLQRIRLGMGPDEVSRHRGVFAQTRSYRVALRVERIVVRGDEAEARGRREDTIVTGGGETIRTPGDFRFALRRVGERWRIERVR